MVDKLKRILDGIIEKHGDVYLFAILQMDEFIDKWTVLFSAPWVITDVEQKSAFEEIRQLLIKEFSPEELSTVARLGILPREEHLVEELLQYSAGAKIEDKQVNGNKVHRGIVLASNKQPQPTAPQKALNL